MLRRLLVVVAVLSTLAVPLAPTPAQAAPTAAVCLFLSGIEDYAAPLPPVPAPPTTTGVNLLAQVNCLGVAPASTFWMNASGTTTGSCAAEAGTATVTVGWASGTMAWVRVGIHQITVLVLGTYVWEIQTGWIPPNIGDCIAPGVDFSTIQGYGPLVGV